MNEKDSPEFQQGLEAEETKKGEQSGQSQYPREKVKVCDKPGRSGSFVRSWGGWEVGGE